MTNRGRAVALLAALGVLFFVAFAFQRSRSSFLAAEARAGEAATLAAQYEIPVAEVLALHELFGGRLAAPELARQVEAFAARRRLLGDELLAVLAVRGRGELVARLRAEAGTDRQRLHELLFESREAVDDAVRFSTVAERYAARGHE